MEESERVKLLAPRAPGPLLANTRFTLVGEPLDFAEWGDGAPWDDYFVAGDKPFWTEDPSYWLLLFRTCPDVKSGPWVRLESEIYADGSGRHYTVDLAKHWGKDSRPAALRPSEAVLLPWGKRFLDSDKRQYELFSYWLLASPFQLAWNRLPALQAKDRACARGDFARWAHARGLEHTRLGLEDLVSGLVIPVASPWQEAFALNRAYVDALRRAHIGPSESKRRFLYGLVRSLVEADSLLLSHLDQTKFLGYPGEVEAKERRNEEAIARAALALEHHLKSRRFRSLLEDFESTKDASAPYKTITMLDRAYRHSAESPSLAPHVHSTAAEMKELLSKHYDLEKGFKDFRKTAKAYWSLVKTFVQAADIKTGMPDWLIRCCEDFADKWYQVTLRTVVRSGGRAFYKPSVDALKRRSTESPVHTRFFALLEILNVACTIKELRASKDDRARDVKTMALAGSIFSLTSSLLDLTKSAKRQWTAAGLGKALTEKPVKGTLGAASALLDMASGSIALVDDADVGDSTTEWFHGAQAAGGVVSLVGYVFIATGGGAPVGALLVFVGSVLGTGGAIGANVTKSSSLQNWMKFCHWGRLAGERGLGEQPQSWADGPPRDLHLEVNRQIRTLNALLIGLEVDISMAYDPNHPEVEVEVRANMIADDGVIHLELVIEGLRMRKLSPWKRGKERGPDGAFRERFSLGDAANVTVRVRLDPFGDGRFWHPADKAYSKSAVLTPPKGTVENPFLGRPF